MKHLWKPAFGPLALVVVAAVLLCLAPPAGAAAGKKNPSGRPPQLERLHQVLEKMNLSNDQVAKITPILDNADEQVMSLKAQSKGKGNKGNKGNKGGARGNLQNLLRQTISEIEQVLTPEQRTTFRNEMRPGGRRNQAPSTQPATA